MKNKQLITPQSIKKHFIPLPHYLKDDMIKLRNILSIIQMPNNRHSNTQLYAFKYPTMGIQIPNHGYSNTQSWAFKYPIMSIQIPNHGHSNTQQWAFKCPTKGNQIPNHEHSNAQLYAFKYKSSHYQYNRVLI
jgi:hypothetical protein